MFSGKINYNDFIKRYLGEKKGAIIELETGRKIGEHNGFWFHTIGQRKGLGLSGGPWYVTGKNTDENIIYVSNGYETEKQYGKVLPLDGMHFISGTPWNEHDYPVEVAFKNRHTPEFSEVLYPAMNLQGLILYILNLRYRVSPPDSLPSFMTGNNVYAWEAASSRRNDN